MYDVEHQELFASIRNGQPIYNGDYMAKSTMMAIMSRMSAYTGQSLTWEQAMNSKEDLSPSSYAWEAQPPKAEQAASAAMIAALVMARPFPWHGVVVHGCRSLSLPPSLPEPTRVPHPIGEV